LGPASKVGKVAKWLLIKDEATRRKDVPILRRATAPAGRAWRAREEEKAPLPSPSNGQSDAAINHQEITHTHTHNHTDTLL